METLMPEENTPKTGEENKNPDGGGFAAITSQDQLDRIIGERINKVKSQFSDYDDLKDKAAKFDEAESANKSELEKEREQREAAEKERDSLKLASFRSEVALSKGLTATQAKRLVGSTKEELEADADELIADLKPTPSPRPDPKRLQSGGTGSNGTETPKERAAAAMRSLRSAH